MTRARTSVVHRTRVAVLGSLALAVFACGCDKPTAPRPKVTVLVACSPGVARNAPDSDSLVVDSGTAVTYSFTSASGHTNLRVTLNDQEVTPSGSFPAVRASRLFAVADSVVTLQASDSGLMAASRALASAADPYQSYQAYQAISDALRVAVGARVANYRLRVAIAEALDPVRDAPALARLERIVAESMSVRPVGQRAPRSAEAATDAPYQVVFLYVNGIGMLLEEFGQTRDGPIKDLVTAAGFSDPARFAVSGFYNPTTKLLSPEMHAAWTCYDLKANLLRLGQFSRWLELPACNAGEAGDLAESVLQVVNALEGLAPGADQPDVLAFADSIERVILRGSRVVLIAHSQGNLYAQQALMHLSLGSLAPRLGCVGVVGNAPPTSEGWPVGASTVGQLMAVGQRSSDILHQLPLLSHSLSVHVATTTTDLFDGWLLFGGLAGPFAVPVLDVLFGIEIHRFNNYYDDGAGRAALISNIQDQVSQTERVCPAIPVVTSLTPSSGPLAGGTPVTITGTSFVAPATATIGGNALTNVAVVNSTTITGTTPASNSSGAKDVIVTTAGGSDTLAACFTYLAAVAIPFVTGGFYHTCGLTSGGVAYCWGQNDSGQVGDGTTYDRLRPVAVGGGLAFRSISAGRLHTCGVTTAGAAYCWGNNSDGQLGDGTYDHRLQPVAVVGGLVFQSISANGMRTCGFTTAGAAYCWGYDGRLPGVGPASPVAVVGGLVFQAISANAGWNPIHTYPDGRTTRFTHPAYTCGLTTYGAAYCWGNNNYGTLGDGTYDNRLLVKVAGDLVFQSISAGGIHTCGVTTAGAAYCWGTGYVGQLGIGIDGTINRPSPVAVLGGHVFQSISAGWIHTCGLTTDGAAYCWGNNNTGQLGDGTTLVNRLSPVAVLGNLRFQTLQVGNQHTCGLTTGGAAYCWGWNGTGQLGDGTTSFKPFPVAVWGSIPFTGAAAEERAGARSH